MFSGLEDYIKFDNSIDKILDVDYIKQLATETNRVDLSFGELSQMEQAVSF